jgi:FtsH-binding integral membrane protein
MQDTNDMRAEGQIPFEKVKQHIFNVYFLLFEALVLAGVGVIAQLQFRFPPVQVILITLVISIGLIIAIGTMQRTNPDRKVCFLAIGFLLGMQMADMIKMAYELNPYIIVTALLGTVTIFGSLSLVAYTADNKRFLNMGGFLGTSLSLLIVVSIISIILGTSDLMHVLILFVGLVLFCAYILYDTQMMMEKFCQGDIDEIFHALGLFLDFCNVFIRLVGLLIEMEKGKNKKDD